MASPNLRSRLLDGVSVLSQRDFQRDFNPNADFGFAETMFGEDSPTGKPMIVLNDDRLQQEGFRGRYREKMILGESLHNLKNVDPKRFERLKFAALSEPEVDRWLRESYSHSKSRGERRSFDDWLTHSRLDQVIGGFLFAGDPDLPTLQTWDREKLPFGKDFRKQLELLERDLAFE